MEVKIKDNNGYVDADWTIENGVMIVSSKVEKFEPKDGDVIVCDSDGCLQLFICKKYQDERCCYCHCFYDVSYSFIEFDESASYCVERYATEEEKQKLFDKLKEEGWEWDAEKKELVKIKWKPKVDETFYYPNYAGYMFHVSDFAHYSQEHLDSDDDIKKGWCLKTKEECQAFCDKLNQAIKSVKP